MVSIALVLNGLEKARASRNFPNQSSATLVVVPNALIDQWSSEIKKFDPLNLRVIKIYDLKSLLQIQMEDFMKADVVICPIDILEAKGYMDHLIKYAELSENMEETPKLPSDAGYTEQTGARGVWIPATSADPYAGGANNATNQKRRNQSAYFTFVYLNAIQALREREFSPSAKGVPLEVRTLLSFHHYVFGFSQTMHLSLSTKYYQWERVIVDEIHESLCTTK